MIKGLISPILTPFNDDLTIANGFISRACEKITHGWWMRGARSFRHHGRGALSWT